jgi:hypothetical protein
MDPRTRSRGLTVVVAVGALMALSACGGHSSPSAHGSHITAGTATGQLPNAATAGSGGSGGTAAKGTVPGTAPGAGGAGGGQLPDAAGGSPGASSGGGAGAVAVPGVAAKPASTSCTVAIGASFPGDVGAASSEAGSGSGSQTNENGPALFQQGITYVNQHGGIGGCQATEVVFGWQDLSDANTQDQQECDLYTESHHVAFAVPGGLEGYPFFQCMASRHVPVIEATNQPVTFDDAQLQSMQGYLYSPDGVSVEHLGGLIDILHTAGWFGTGSKVGIVMNDALGSEEQTFVNTIWKPALARYGMQITSEFTYNSSQATNTATAIATASTQSQSLVLQFRGAGVNHVLFAPQAGEVLPVLGSVANSQSWYPQWAETTADFPKVAALAPKQELAGVTLFGWSPPVDNNSANGLPNNAAVSRCEAIYPRSEWASMPFTPQFWCDSLFFAQQALATSTGFSVAQFEAGVRNLGSSFQSASGFGPTQFGQGRYDGGVEGRLAKYGSVGAFEYYGGFYQLP